MTFRWRGDYTFPVLLVLAGVYFLLRNLGLLDWLRWDYAFPVAMIVVGLWLIWRRSRTGN